ncbi:MAG: hypothetical protein M5U14_13810 [Acidimicrobiia bacterium]|nr:hypothetical protein [Acidimicrobiia bacterium]
MAVQEDWDFLLRAALLCGVLDTRRPTAIYHRWEGGGASLQSVGREVWISTRQSILHHLDGRPLLLPAGHAKRLADHVRSSLSLGDELDRTRQELERAVGAMHEAQVTAREARVEAYERVKAAMADRARAWREAEHLRRDVRRALEGRDRAEAEATRARVALEAHERSKLGRAAALARRLAVRLRSGPVTGRSRRRV